MGTCSGFVFSLTWQLPRTIWTQTVCINLGWGKTDRVRAASGSPSISLGVALTTTCCAKDMEFFSSSIVYCFPHSRILAHQRSQAVLELSHLHAWHLAEEPSTLGRNWPLFWLGCRLVIWVSSPSLVPQSFHFRACMQAPNHLPMPFGGVHLTWCTGVMTQV